MCVILVMNNIGLSYVSLFVSTYVFFTDKINENNVVEATTEIEVNLCINQTPSMYVTYNLIMTN